MIKVLNLYAGIGGNRKLWEDVEVTAVELNPKIAKLYKHFFPEDKVIVGDAHEYLLDHYKEFDFIWSSPPCPTHSDIRRCGVHRGLFNPKYPDMKLYEEIIFLKHFNKCPYVVENVKGYYKPLIRPYEIDRHYFWSSFPINPEFFKKKETIDNPNQEKGMYGFRIKDFDIDNKRKILRNLVNPELGKYVFNCAFSNQQITLEKLMEDSG